MASPRKPDACRTLTTLEHSRLARKALALYNREGVFTNLADDLDGLERTLAQEFAEQQIEVRGSFALFTARI